MVVMPLHGYCVRKAFPAISFAPVFLTPTPYSLRKKNRTEERRGL